MDIEGFMGEDGAESNAPPNVGQVLLHLDTLKADIIREVQASADAMRQESEALRREVLQKLASVSTEVERAVLTASRVASSRSQGSRSRGSSSMKRLVPVPDDVTDIELIAQKDVAVLSLMRCTLMFTVFSFVHAVPNLDMWLTEKLKENMSDIVPLLTEVSGFSLLFFSVASDNSKQRFSSRMGGLWSRLCTSTIVLIALTARATHYRAQQSGPGDQAGVNRALPGWLSSLGGLKKATSIVATVVECLERSNQLPMIRAAKRQRTEDGGVMEVAQDPHRGEREQAIRVMRSLVLRALSTGRTEARVYIFKSFLFLVEKIRGFPSVSEAKSQGYEISLRPSKTAEELALPASIARTIWEVAKSHVQTKDDASVDTKNAGLFETLTSRFQSLTVCLRYKRRVLRGENVVPEELCSDDGELYWHVEENVSLHKVAMGILVEMFKVKNYLTVLGSSGLALRAVHVYAVALRGLVKKSMDIPLSNLEKSALGDVTFRTLDKNDELATVMLGVRMEKTRDGSESATLDRERAQKLDMTWNAYQAAKKKREEMRGEDIRAAGEHGQPSTHTGTNQGLGGGCDQYEVGWFAGGDDV